MEFDPNNEKPGLESHGSKAMAPTVRHCKLKSPHLLDRQLEDEFLQV